jgi:hypothetical protein
MPSMQPVSRRNFRAGTLSAAIVLVLSSCASSDTSTVESGTTVPSAASQEAGDAPSNSDAAAPTVPAGDASVALDWIEAGISGETFTDQMLVTDKGLVAYRFAHGPMAWVSEAGIDWASADLVVESTNAEFGVFSITAGGPGYVAHGSDQWNVEALEHNEVIWTSPDGFVWSRHELDLDYPDLGVFSSILVGPVVGGPDGLLLIGRMDRGDGGPDEHRFFVWTSDDGSDWNLVANAFPDGAYIGDIRQTANGFVTQGLIDGPDGGEEIWVSTSGRSWEGVNIEDIDAELTGLVGKGLAIWGDVIVAAGETEDGIRLWTSVDGRDWAQLPASSVLERPEQGELRLDQVFAGPLGIVLVGEITRTPQAEPPIVMEKDDVILTLDFGSESGRVTVTDRSTGTLLIDAEVVQVIEGEVEDVAFSADFSSITVVHPNTGEQTTFTEGDFEEARIKANEAAGIEPGSEGEEIATPVFLFSPDGQRWTSVDLEDTFEADSLPDPDSGVVVGTNSIILRWRDHPEDEEGSEEEFEEDPPDVIWVGTLAGGS